MSNPTSRASLIKTRSPVTQAMRWAAIDALIGAACAALYGLMFAAVGALLYGEPGKIVATTLYFAGCGAVAGILVSVIGAIIGGETDSCEDDWPASAEEELSDPAVQGRETRSMRKPVNRLAEIDPTPLPASDDESRSAASHKTNPTWN